MSGFKLTAWQLVVLVALVLAAGLAVLYMTPGDVRGDVISKTAAGLGGLIAAAVAAVGAKQAHTAKTETRAQGATLETISHNVNGNLTARLDANRQATVTDIMGQLEARGIIPPATDAAPVGLEGGTL